MSADSPAGKVHRRASVEIRWRLSMNLKRLRKAQAYTQVDLAKLCATARATSATSSKVPSIAPSQISRRSRVGLIVPRRTY